MKFGELKERDERYGGIYSDAHNLGAIRAMDHLISVIEQKYPNKAVLVELLKKEKEWFIEEYCNKYGMGIEFVDDVINSYKEQMKKADTVSELYNISSEYMDFLKENSEYVDYEKLMLEEDRIFHDTVALIRGRRK